MIRYLNGELLPELSLRAGNDQKAVNFWIGQAILAFWRVAKVGYFDRLLEGRGDDVGEHMVNVSAVIGRDNGQSLLEVDFQDPYLADLSCRIPLAGLPANSSRLLSRLMTGEEISLTDTAIGRLGDSDSSYQTLKRWLARSRLEWLITQDDGKLRLAETVPYWRLNSLVSAQEIVHPGGAHN
ncbi:MAG TPA: hypothetical protein VMW41_02595 [Candidatus Bathyarchaeia archaeon]|nr:hypothetical protein [Candidatus Bathyarchaeia archaeon]